MPRRVPLPPQLEGHAFSVDDARAAGLNVERLRSADLSRPFYGVRVASPAADVLAHCHAYARRMQPGQFFSHVTAARIWGAPLPTEFTAAEPLHVSSVAPRRPPHTRGVIGHELRSGTGALVLRQGLAVTDPATTWLHLSGLLTPAELVVVGDHLVLDPYLLDPLDPRPFATIADLGERLASFRGRGRRAAADALSRVRVGAESRPETLLRLLLVDAGLPEPEPNRVLRGPAGNFLGRVDLVYPQWRIVVEYDGDQHRSNSSQYERDLSRLDGIRHAGWLVIQVRRHGLFVRPDVTVAKVRAALQQAGWRA